MKMCWSSAVVLEQGQKVTDTDKLRRHYVRTTQFKLDVLSLLPTDLVYIGLGTEWAVIFRLNRLLRTGRLVQVRTHHLHLRHICSQCFLTVMFDFLHHQSL